MKKSIFLAVLAFCAVSFSMANELGAAPVAVLDSTVYDGIGGKTKEAYVRDEKGRLTALINYSWGVNAWKETSKTEFVYDVNDNLTVRTFFFYSSSDWEASNKSEYEYDAKGNMTKETNSYWNSSESKWTLSDREVNKYDANDHMIQRIKCGWSSSDEKWIEYEKYNYEYTGGNRTKEVYSWWNTSSETWVYSWKFDYTYDAKDSLTLVVKSDYDTDAWHEADKEVYTYVDGNRVKDEFFYLDGSGWKESSKIERKFDDDHHCTVEEESNYDVIKDQYVYSQKTEWTYTNGLLTRLTFFYWADTKWEATTKQEFAYDEYGTMNQSQSFNWNSVSEMYELDGTTVYYYHYDGPTTAINTVPEAAVKSVKVMRNGHVLIIREGKAYDLNGKVVE